MLDLHRSVIYRKEIKTVKQSESGKVQTGTPKAKMKPIVPIVTGISPNEATPGTKITIRGENFGTSAADLFGVNILGSDCMMTSPWMSANKIIALSPAKEGKGEIFIATKSGGLGTCNVSLRIYKETIGPLKEVATWMPEKFQSRRKTRRSSPTEQDDPLGLHVEERDSGKISEEQLQIMFPEATGNIGSDNFEPAYFLLDKHRSTTFDDLKAGLSYLKRKVDGENESQLSFIKSNAIINFCNFTVVFFYQITCFFQSNT